MADPILFGAAYSVYVRIARLALHEKGVAYRLVEVDVFAEGGPPADYLERQPFGRIPAFEHDGFRLYETAAIVRYVDAAFAGPPLMPSDSRACARANQIMSLLDSYGYRPMVWDLYLERVAAPREGRTTDETKVADALPRIETCLKALAALTEPAGPFLLGGEPTLADLHAAPMIAYLALAPEGKAMLDREPRIARWWLAMRARPSMAATRYPNE